MITFLIIIDSILFAICLGACVVDMVKEIIKKIKRL